MVSPSREETFVWDGYCRLNRNTPDRSSRGAQAADSRVRAAPTKHLPWWSSRALMRDADLKPGQLPVARSGPQWPETPN